MKRFLLVTIPLLVVGLLIGWRVNQKNAEAAAQVAMQEARGKAPVPVQVAPVQRRNVKTTFSAVGTLEAPLAVDLAPKLAARVIFLQVREGVRVKRGEVLAQLEASDLEAEIHRKEAVFEQAKARLVEARLGRDTVDVGVQTEIRTAEAALATAQAQERQAEADYDQRIAAAEAAVTDVEGRIAQADATIAQADAAIATAKANLENAETRLRRQEELLKEGAVAAQIVDDEKTAVKVQKAALDEAKQRREAAVATRASTVAQKQSAEKQVIVTRNQATATRDTAKEAVRQTQASLDAAKSNRSRKPAYDRNLEALEASVQAAEADLRFTKAQRNALTLRSPLDGIVVRRYLDPGAVASPTAPVLAVQATSEVWVNIGVPEETSRSLSMGQTATIALDAFPGRTFTGYIQQMEPAADPQSRQFTIRVALENENSRLKPGISARVAFVTKEFPNVLTVPREAVRIPRQADEQPTAILADKGKAVVRPLKIGATDGKVIIIEDGLTEQDNVVILTGRDLKDGQAITVGTEETPSGTKEGTPEGSATR